MTHSTGEHLSGSRFERVDLSDAELRSVDLTRARFRGVDMTGVVMTGVEQSSGGAVVDGLTDESLAGRTQQVDAPGWPPPRSFR